MRCPPLGKDRGLLDGGVKLDVLGRRRHVALHEAEELLDLAVACYGGCENTIKCERFRPKGDVQAQLELQAGGRLYAVGFGRARDHEANVEVDFWERPSAVGDSVDVLVPPGKVSSALSQLKSARRPTTVLRSQVGETSTPSRTAQWGLGAMQSRMP